MGAGFRPYPCRGVGNEQGPLRDETGRSKVSVLKKGSLPYFTCSEAYGGSFASTPPLRSRNLLSLLHFFTCYACLGRQGNNTTRVPTCVMILLRRYVSSSTVKGSFTLPSLKRTHQAYVFGAKGKQQATYPPLGKGVG